MKKQLYEGMYILRATLSDGARTKALERIESGIKLKGGEIHKVHDQGRKKLAYQMDGAKEGHYYLLYFSAPTNALDELWRDYHLNEDMIRFMTLRADEVKEEIKFQELPQ